MPELSLVPGVWVNDFDDSQKMDVLPLGVAVYFFFLPRHFAEPSIAFNVIFQP